MDSVKIKGKEYVLNTDLTMIQLKERALARLHGFPACFFIYTYISYNLT
jgi:hypothetical protein